MTFLPKQDGMMASNNVIWAAPVAGNWGTAASWSNDAVPTASSDVTISAAGSYDVTILAPAVANAVTLNAANATLTDSLSLSLAAGLAVDAGSFELSDGATLSGGTVTAGGAGNIILDSGCVLNNVDYAVSFPALSDPITDLTIGISGTLSFADDSGAGTKTITTSYVTFSTIGNATIDDVTLDLGYKTVLAAENGGTLTIGTHATIDSNGTENIGGQEYSSSVEFDGAAVNNGTLTGSMNSTDDFTNAGVISLSGSANFQANGGNASLDEQSHFLNTGIINISGGETFFNGLTIGSLTGFSNTGHILLTDGGIVIFYSNVDDAQLASVLNGNNASNGSDGSILLLGTLQNSGTLSLAAYASAGITLSLDEGTLQGGTLVGAAGAGSLGNGTLSGVTCVGTINATSLDLSNGDSFTGVSAGSAGVININAGLKFSSDMTLNNVTVNAGPAFNYSSANVSVTLGKNCIFNSAGQEGDIEWSGGGLINLGIMNFGAYNNIVGTATSNNIYETSFMNEGTITVSVNSSLMITASSFANTGSIQLSAGDTFRLDGNLGAASLAGIGGQNFTLSLAGTLENTGSTLNLASYGENSDTIALGGAIDGGMIIDAAGAMVFSDAATLSNLAYQGSLSLDHNVGGETVTLATVTFSGANGDGHGVIEDTGIDSSVVLDSPALANVTIDIGSASSDLSTLMANTPWFILWKSAEIVQTGKNVVIAGMGPAMGLFTNKGVIDAAPTGGGVMQIATPSFTNFANSGEVIAGHDAIVEIYSNDGTINNLTNLKSGTLTGGTYVVERNGTIELAQNQQISTLAATITLIGAHSVISAMADKVSFDRGLRKIGHNGQLNLLDGRGFAGGHSLTNAGSISLRGGNFAVAALNQSSVAQFSGCGTIAASIANNGTIAASGGTLLLTGSVTGSGVLHIDAGATLDIAGAASPSEIVDFNGKNGTLGLQNATSYVGTIADLAAADVMTVGLGGAASPLMTSASISGTLLSIGFAGGASLTETLLDPTAGLAVTIGANGETLLFTQQNALHQPHAALAEMVPMAAMMMVYREAVPPGGNLAHATVPDKYDHGSLAALNIAHWH
jgi:hypothetical protein